MTNLLSHLQQVVDYLLNRQPAQINMDDLQPGTFMLLPNNLYGVYLRPCGSFLHFFQFHPDTGCLTVRGYSADEIQAPEEGEMFVVLRQMTETALEKIQRVAVTHLAN